MTRPVEPQQPQEPLTGGLASLIEQRKSIISAAHSPLVFFVLALLIIEVFIICAGIFFDLPTSYRVALIFAGIFLFVLVFGTVAALVYFVPRNVVFGEESHLRYAAMEKYGTDRQSVSGDRLIEMQPTSSPQVADQPTQALPSPAPQDKSGDGQ